METKRTGISLMEACRLKMTKSTMKLINTTTTVINRLSCLMVRFFNKEVFVLKFKFVPYTF